MITQNIKQVVALMVAWMVSLAVFATDGTIVVNNQMPSREVSIIATQAVILKPGFHAVGTTGTFDAQIGKINSVYPAITLAEGSGAVQQPLPTEKVTVTGSYVKITIPMQGVTDATALNAANSVVGIKYFDGLGRGNMTVLKNYCPSGKDLATVVNYDEYGRVSNQWLATPINSASNPEPGIVMQQAKNYYGDDNPYSTVDQSAITTASTYKPGVNFRTNGKAYQQGLPPEFINDVRRYIIDQDNITLLSMDDALFDIKIQQSTDEDGHTGFVFTNINGKVVLKRMVNDGANPNHDTYFLYNDLGQLCYVLSPEASDKMATTGDYSRATIDTPGSTLAQYAYAYTYDEAGRCIAKKIPGKAWENIIYDQANQVAFTQDGNQHQSDQWTYYKYDNLGRPIQSGTTKLTDSEAETIRTTYASTTAKESYTAGVGYTSTKSLGSDTKLLTEQYYDSYNFLTLPAYSALASNLAYSGAADAKYSKVVDGVDIALLGKPTGTWVAMLEDAATPPTLLTAMYYDDNGRVIQSNASNQLGGYDKDSYTYNFGGQMMTNTHNHSSTTATVTELYTMKYDRTGRTTSVRHKLNSQAEIVMDSLLYDETGRATRKILHGGMQTVDYTYNLQGQLKSLSSPAFSETLMYSDPDPNGTPLYNGSIASVQYSNGSGYRYTYDGLNRLKTADHTDINNPDNDNGTFSERIDLYDKNGNIKQLTRSGLVRDQFNMTNGVAPIMKHNLDQLTMDYDGNQVQKTADANNTSQYLSVGMADFADLKDDANPDKAEYQYDKNGNCTADLNKNIAWTTYNLLNRPQTVQMTTGNKTYYAYDATGVKRRAEYYTTQSGIQVPLGDYTQELGKNNLGTIDQSNWTDYCGRYVYVDGTLARILTPEGYVQVAGTNAANWRYAYNLTDHVGSSRAQLLSDPLSSATSKGYTVTSTSEYYPMGMEIRRSFDNNTSGTNPYLYGGKELERMHGLNLYEFPYRWYDYAVPGFTTPDPLAEERYSESPYSYCGGDPVNRVDPTGLMWYQYGEKWVLYSNEDKPSIYGPQTGYMYSRKGPTIMFISGSNTYFGDESGGLTLMATDPNASITSGASYKAYVYEFKNTTTDYSQANGLDRSPVFNFQYEHHVYKECYFENGITFIDSYLKTPTAFLSTKEIKTPETSESTLNRVFGAAQLAGGTLEAVVGGVGGIASAGTGVGALAGYLILLNGIDNMQTGARQLWTGQTQETLLHQGTRSMARAAGASNSTAQMIATSVDYSTIFLGSAGSAKALYSPYKGAKVVEEVVEESTQLWTSTSKMSSAKNAFGHWKKHGAEFPEFLNAKQYVEGAKNFMHNSPAGTLMKTRANGDILKYHPGTNIFGVMDATGVPRTMFRPTDGMKYWLGQ